MLIETLKERESLIIGREDDVAALVEVIILEIKGGNVTMGINLPRTMPIYRGEVYEVIRRTDMPDEDDS